MDRRSRNTLVHIVLHLGIARKKESPLIGSTAPKAYLYSLIWWQGTSGLSPLVQQYLGTLILPKPASSSNMTLISTLGLANLISPSNSLIFLRQRSFRRLPFSGAAGGALFSASYVFSAAYRYILVPCPGPISHQMPL